ncbi:MAG: hypothetical protein IPO69_09020 [Saprospiraceae bacterium]|nr:hypothetical protein [Saprospiraceae bacterium]
MYATAGDGSRCVGWRGSVEIAMGILYCLNVVIDESEWTILQPLRK